jgi:hypothetical protein
MFEMLGNGEIYSVFCLACGKQEFKFSDNFLCIYSPLSLECQCGATTIAEQAEDNGGEPRYVLRQANLSECRKRMN